jgi:hypothetical protein
MQNITIGSTKVRRDAQGRYCLNDVHGASGALAKHRPGYFLGNDQTRELVAEIEKAGIPAISAKQGVGTYACRELVIAYAAWISPKFHLHVLRTYDAAMRAEFAGRDDLYLQALKAERAYDDAKSEASRCGRGLRWWRGVHRDLGLRIEHCRQQLQLTLPT